MITVAQELGKWPPKVIDNPTQQLFEELEEVKDYTVYVDKILMHITLKRKRLESVSNRWTEYKEPSTIKLMLY